MKNLLFFFFFLSLSSFCINSIEKKLPNGKYLVELEQKYIDSGLKNFKFTIENEICIMEIAKKLENLEVNWIDENSFIVKGYTEPANPNNVEREIMKNYIISFNITREDKDEYYFTLGNQSNEDIIYSGKFVKIK